VIYKTDKFTIFFGDAASSIAMQEIAEQMAPQSLSTLFADLQTSQYIFLRQEHTDQGFILALDDQQSQFFQMTGDFILTKKKNVGIGVVTADCLPIIVYDFFEHAAAIIHAGWRGLAADIFAKTVCAMQQEFDSKPENLKIYCGPSAGSCCYEVQADFYDHFKKYADHEQYFIKKDKKLFFDARQFIQLNARSLGIAAKNIYTTYNACTICNSLYCSYRREKENARRQISIISLH